GFFSEALAADFTGAFAAAGFAVFLAAAFGAFADSAEDLVVFLVILKGLGETEGAGACSPHGVRDVGFAKGKHAFASICHTGNVIVASRAARFPRGIEDFARRERNTHGIDSPGAPDNVPIVL